MTLAARIKSLWRKPEKPLHLQYGQLGERAAKKHLKRLGLKFLTANFRSPRGEIDLICRDVDCLLFVSFHVYFILRVINRLHGSTKNAGSPPHHRHRPSCLPSSSSLLSPFVPRSR